MSHEDENLEGKIANKEAEKKNYQCGKRKRTMKAGRDGGIRKGLPEVTVELKD